MARLHDYTPSELGDAVRRVLGGGESQRYVSKLTGIPKSTIQDNCARVREDIIRSRKTVGDGSRVSDPKEVYSRILFISDQHAPYTHPDALSFLSALKEKHAFDKIVNLGDEMDYHAMSFHDSDPNLYSASDELDAAREWLHKLHDIFPDMDIVESNHGSMKYRKAKHHGVPRGELLSYRASVFGEQDERGDIYYPGERGRGWTWHPDLILQTPHEPVAVKHGGAKNTEKNVLDDRCCYVQGHFHEDLNIVYISTPRALLWGMTSGCLIDKKSYAFAYNQGFKKRPIIGCTGCIEGFPVIFPMPLDSEGRWTGKLA